MKMHAAACVAATLLAGLTGCSATPTTTLGQSTPIPSHKHRLAGHDQTVNPVPNRYGGANTIQNPIHDQHDFPSTTSYHSTSGYPGYNGFACPTGGCKQGTCPPGGCPGGCGPQCGHHQFGKPHHYHSYSYSRPSNLSYPGPTATGGAVVYPYYTHKGPSDFFLDDGSVLNR